MPNGGIDNYGVCGFNKANGGKWGWPDDKGALERAYCTIRDVPIPNPLWTYCANRHTKSDIPYGPILTSGLHEKGILYRRIPWHGKNCPQHCAAGKCAVCDNGFENGLQVDDKEGPLTFCCNDHYLNWWKQRHPDCPLERPPKHIPIAEGVWKTSRRVDDQITLTHVAVMLGQGDLAYQMLDLANDPSRLAFFPLTKFWKEYARGFLHLCRGEPYSPASLQPKGYEKCWMPYLALMSALSQAQDGGLACLAIDQSFNSRNRDKRLIDWEMIDGDGKHPVQWDFRRYTLLNCRLDEG